MQPQSAVAFSWDTFHTIPPATGPSPRAISSAYIRITTQVVANMSRYIWSLVEDFAPFSIRHSTLCRISDMFLKHRFRGLGPFLCALSTLLAASASSEAVCSRARDPTPKVYVVEYSIYIKTDVQYNTSFAVNNDLTITVDNAPTELDLTTTHTSRKTTTQSPDKSVLKSV